MKIRTYPITESMNLGSIRNLNDVRQTLLQREQARRDAIRKVAGK